MRIDGKEYRRIVEKAVRHLGHSYRNPPTAYIVTILAPFMACVMPSDKAAKRVALVEAARRAMMVPAPAPKKERAPAHKPKADQHHKGDSFYASWEWKRARYEAIKVQGRRCKCCGWRPGDTELGHLVVDHVKPLALFPDLALAQKNLQVLCNDCNMGKGRKHYDDFR